MEIQSHQSQADSMIEDEQKKTRKRKRQIDRSWPSGEGGSGEGGREGGAVCLSEWHCVWALILIWATHATNAYACDVVT